MYLFLSTLLLMLLLKVADPSRNNILPMSVLPTSLSTNAELSTDSFRSVITRKLVVDERVQHFVQFGNQPNTKFADLLALKDKRKQCICISVVDVVNCVFIFRNMGHSTTMQLAVEGESCHNISSFTDILAPSHLVRSNPVRN